MVLFLMRAWLIILFLGTVFVCGCVICVHGLDFSFFQYLVPMLAITGASAYDVCVNT